MAELKEEITQFQEEINEMIEEAKNISGKSKLRFDPMMFMIWRLARSK